MAVGKPLMDQKPTHQGVRQGRSADDYDKVLSFVGVARDVSFAEVRVSGRQGSF
jgi:hypothetical protein